VLLEGFHFGNEKKQWGGEIYGKHFFFALKVFPKWRGGGKDWEFFLFFLFEIISKKYGD
jgi:hypothetical protein